MKESNVSIRLNPNSEIAKSGLEKLQKVMRGEDPEEEANDEDEQMNEEEDE